MSWGAVIAAGGALVGGALGGKGAKDASRAEQRGNALAIEEQRRQFDLMREDTAPYRSIGTQAINALGGIYGYSSAPPAVGDTSAPANALAPRGGIDPSSGYMPTGSGGIRRGVTIDNATGQVLGNELAPAGATAIGPPMPAGPDYSNFFASPDYQFRRQQGTQGIERTASARGLTGSGNALAALADYNSGLAAEEFGNYFNRQATLAGVGQSAVNTSTQAGANSATNIGNALIGGGQARASGIGDAANAWANAAGTIGGIVYDRWGRPKKTGGG